MLKIDKATETMTSKERVQKTFNYEKTDRVTIGYEANSAIHKNVCKALGIKPDDHEGLLQAIGVDYRSVSAPYTGPELFKAPPGRKVDHLEGAIMRWVEHETGGYWDFCDFPLLGASEEAFNQFPVPNPDHFDYAAALELAKSYNNIYALYIGGAGIPDIINSNGRIMGMEDILCYLLTEDDYAINFVERRVRFQLGFLERLLDKCKNLIDFMWLGEDLGTQTSPMISLETYRKVLKPIHKNFAELAAAYSIPSMIHTCGSSSWAYEDFIEIGIKGVDTLQPEAANMSPEYLVQHFGGRLNFRGCISTAGPLAYGTPEDVINVCKETLNTMKKVKGYHFAPTHQIQDNSPVENVIAMYQAVHDFGHY
jgi:uroporphyrinogen decarboxylase